MQFIILLYFCSLSIITNEEPISGKTSWIKQPVQSGLERRVVNGEDANIEDYPFMVFVSARPSPSSSDAYACGGTIINATHILTAGHCVGVCEIDGIIQNTCQEYTPDLLTVRVGVTVPNDSLDFNKFSVKKVHIHPNFQPLALEQNCETRFDIAVLELNGNIEFSEKASPVALPEAVDLKDIGDSKTNAYGRDRMMCTVLGWGFTDEYFNTVQPPFQNLQVARIPLVDTATCTKYAGLNLSNLKPFCNDTHICTMDPLEETGVCFADSGGPILCAGVQVGVTSNGVHCIGPDMPNTFTRTDILVDWLKGTSNSKIFHVNRFLFLILYLIKAM